MALPTSPGLNFECRRIVDVMALLGDRWTFTVVATLAEGACRFNVLRRVIGGISQQMLTRTLRTLERDGMVKRTVFHTVPPQVEYALTPLGEELAVAVSHFAHFAAANSGQIEANRLLFDARNASETMPGALNVA